MESGYAYKYLSGDNEGKLTTGHVGTADVEVVPAILKGSLTVTAEELTAGSNLTAVFAPDTDEWVNGDIGVYTYTWYRVGESGDVEIQTSQTPTNSMSDTYTLTEDDLHSQIYCVVKSGKCGNNVTSHEITVPGQSVSPAGVTLSADSFPYNGTAQTPAVTVVLDGKTLTENTDYTVSYRNNKNAGTATVEIRGEGKYEGLTSRTFTITRRAVTVSGITVQEKIYDGDTAAVLNFDNVMFDGMADGDRLTVTAAGTFSDGNVGENKIVTIIDLTLGGTSADNYELAGSGQQTTAIATISPKAAILTWGENTTRTYNGEEQTITASVSNAIGNDSFTLSYENNGTTTNKATEAGSYTATVTGLGNDNYTLDGTVNRSQNWSIRYLTAEDARLSGTMGNNGWYLSTVTLTPPEGYMLSGDKTSWQDALTISTEGTQTVEYYLKDGNGGITDRMSVEVKIDTVAPTGEIQIKENGFKGFLNAITFGYFFKETVGVSITGTDDNSGVASIEYQKVENMESYDAEGTWTAGSSFTIEPEEKCIVYARITDQAGWRTIINSEGFVVYTDVAEAVTVAFAKMSIDDADAGITLNGNTVASIVKDGGTISDSSYTVVQDRLILRAAYLDTLEIGTYTLTVSYHPLGETFTADTSKGEAPQTTTITLIIKKRALFVETAPVLSGIYGTAVKDLTVNTDNAKVINSSGTEISGTWSITDANLTAVPVADSKESYELTFTPTDMENYDSMTVAVAAMIEKAATTIRTNPTAAEITYGQALSDSALSGGEANTAGRFVWTDGITKPSVADSNTTEYDVTFLPSDEANYKTANCRIMIIVNKAGNAPGMPGGTMNVAYGIKKVGDISLSDHAGWVWQDSDREKVLEVGKTITATAIYTGSDKGNYKTESVEVNITRNDVDHADTDDTDGENEKAADSQSGEDTRDTADTEREALPASGTTTPKKEHSVSTVATEQPQIEGDNDRIDWNAISSQIDEAKDGDTIKVDMNGSTIVPKTVFESIKDRDVNVIIYMNDQITWTVNGKNVSKIKGDIDLGVTCGRDAGRSIPVDIINQITGENYSLNLTLAYSGEFGFKATLTVNVEEKNAGYYANLFYYNPDSNKMEFMCAGEIGADGTVDLTFTHASDYTIIISDTVMDGKKTEESTEDGTPASTSGQNTVKEADETNVWKIVGIVIMLIAVAGLGVVVVKRKNKKQ